MISVIMNNLTLMVHLHAAIFACIMPPMGSGSNILSTVPDLNKGLIGMGAGMATTGCLGAGIGQGFSAGKASEAIGRNPAAAPKIRTIMIIGAAIAESGAIYSLLISLMLIFIYNN